MRNIKLRFSRKLIFATQKLDPNESSYIVIVTRGHRDDMRVLRWAVQTPARYVGMIGSKRKVIEIFKTLQEEGVPAHLFDRVHAPVGLDIGSQTVPEIAVSIVAELIARRNLGPSALAAKSGHPGALATEPEPAATPARG